MTLRLPLGTLQYASISHVRRTHTSSRPVWRSGKTAALGLILLVPLRSPTSQLRVEVVMLALPGDGERMTLAQSTVEPRRANRSRSPLVVRVPRR
jgi:hypothetical protein